MTISIDWPKLVARNRVKAPGMPWTKEESKALANGVSPDDVRAGFLEIPEDVPGTEKELERMNIAELSKKAKGLGIEFDAKSVIRADLVLEIQKAEKKATIFDKDLEETKPVTTKPKPKPKPESKSEPKGKGKGKK